MAHPTDVHVGGRIKELRVSRGMTQTDLATAIKISFQQVQKYEKGTNRVGSSRLWEIANVLGVEPAYFFEGLVRHGAPPAPALSAAAVKLAKQFDTITDQNVRNHFAQLVKGFGKGV